METTKEYPSFKSQFLEVSDMFKELMGSYTIVSIRNSQNTADAFYESEMQYFDEAMPSIQKMSTDFKNFVTDSTFKAELTQEFGKQFFDLADVEKKTINQQVLPLLQKENELTTKYQKLVSQIQIEFDGKSYNMAGMSPLLQNVDREFRKRASKAFYTELLKHQPSFDSIYDELVQVRQEIAEKLHEKNFVAVGYHRMGRTCYGPQQIAKYRDFIHQYVTPKATQIQQMIKESLGQDHMYQYDTLTFADGNPTPKTSPEQMILDAQKMYNEMSKETGEFFNQMQIKGMLDLLNRDGKTPGGYCTYVDAVKSPFIFSNFNGTAHDVDVLTHEAGHAFQCYCSMHFQLSDYYFPTSDAAEIHSMSMEFFAWKWVNLFFQADTDKYKLNHLIKSLMFLPYGVSVDEFQQRVYEKPKMTPEERRKTWLEIQSKYMPWIEIDNEPYLQSGGRWQTQSHIFQMPFYYIDYTLAQVCAFQFHNKLTQNFENAWLDYYNLCQKGGSLNFLELVKVAKLESPFEENGIKNTIESIFSEIQTLFQNFNKVSPKA